MYWNLAGDYWYASNSATLFANDGDSIESLATGNTGHFAVFDAYYANTGDVGSLITPRLVPVAGTGDTLTYSVNLIAINTYWGIYRRCNVR